MAESKSKKRKRSVAKSWDRLHRWFDQHLPKVLKGLNKGASSKSIKDFEKQTRRTLPDDFQESVRIHDGDNEVGCIWGLWLLSLDLVLESWELQRGLPDDGAAWADGKAYPAQAIQQCQTHPGWIPITNDWSGDHLALDLAPGLEGTWGQVFVLDRPPYETFVAANSWSEFLAEYADQLKAGNYRIEPFVDDLGIEDPDITVFCPKDLPGDHYHDFVRHKYIKKRRG